MTPKNKLFIGILILGLIVNLLVIFDLNYLYIRAILAFIFLITIPGLLIMLCLKIRNINFWEYLVYTIGLSVSFIMFAGLAVNWILPFLNITDKPLSLWPILISFDTILLALWLIAQRRNEDNAHILIFPFEEYEIKGKKRFKFIPKFPSFSWLDRIFIIIPFFFPFMAVIGAFLLNNHGTNIVTMIMLGSIAVYVFCVVLFRDKLNENVFPWALWMIGLSLLLMYSMRSWYVLGVDVNQEMKVAKLVLLSNHWTMNLFQNAYNACLSLAIFSPILKIFLNLKIDLIFKLIIQVLFSFLPVILYLMFKKIIDKNIIIFLSCFFFISQIWFIQQMSALIRQEIAYLFFSLFFLMLFSNHINFRNILLFIFGVSVIVSHYSTSYIFLFSLLSIFLFINTAKGIPFLKCKMKKIELSFSLILLLILLISGFLWTFQITPVGSGLTDVVRDTYSKIGEIFSSEGRSETVQSLMFKKIDYLNIYNNYSREVINLYKNKELDLLDNDYSSNIQYSIMEPIEKYSLYKTLIAFNIIIGFYFKALIILGVFFAFLFIKNIKRKEYLIFCIFFILITILIIVLPYISFSYNLERLFLQALIFISVIAIYFGYIIFNYVFKNKNISIFLILILLLYFFLSISLQVFFTFSGGASSNILFKNSGTDFNKFFITGNEIRSLNWIDKFSKKDNIFYFDRYAELKVFSTLPNFSQQIFTDINSGTIDRSSYVFSSSSNMRGISTVYYGGVLFNLKYPTEFLNDNKNKIYNNGGSEIFK